MRNVFLGVVGFAALAHPAIGADLGPPAPVTPIYSPVVSMAYDWSGIYFGGFGSYSWSNTNSTTTNTTTGVSFAPMSSSTSAWHGGGQIGFDYMMPSHIVIGILTDLSSGNTTSSTTVDAFGTSSNQNQTFVSGTVRGRLGYAIDRILLYATGGWVWSSDQAVRTQVTGSVGNAVVGTTESVDRVPEGWTAGGGIAFTFAQNWNVFAEYRYANLQSTITFPIAQRSTNLSTSVNVAEVGLNYKFDWGPVGCRWNERSC